MLKSYTIRYVPSAKNDLTQVHKFTLVFLCCDFTRRLDDEVNKARAHEEWKVEYMSLFLRDQEMREEGREEGREEERRVLVRNMIQANETVEKICLYANCDESFVEMIRRAMDDE